VKPSRVTTQEKEKIMSMEVKENLEIGGKMRKTNQPARRDD